MNKNTTQFLIGAAVAGIIGAGSALVSSTSAKANAASDKGHCIGANSCKGKSGCAVSGHNECAGHNACKGKGFLETTKAACDKLAKKNKKIHFKAGENHEG